MSCNRTPPFHSLISNGEYIVGCTGQTVYVYDINNTLVAKYPKHRYVYYSAFSPCGDMFAVKSVEGYLAFYSLKDYSLLKKFRFSKVDGAQDDGFCFSPDGNEFYNIERQINSCISALSIYDTKDFSLKKRLFQEDIFTELSDIEYDTESDAFYIIGFFRDKKSRVANERYIAKLINDEMKDIVIITNKEYVNCTENKRLKRMGFSKAAREYFETNPDDKSYEEDWALSHIYNLKKSETI